MQNSSLPIELGDTRNSILKGEVKNVILSSLTVEIFGLALIYMKLSALKKKLVREAFQLKKRGNLGKVQNKFQRVSETEK